MSNTYKTDPWLVRARRSKALRIRHDHDHGQCTLTEIPTVQQEVDALNHWRHECRIDVKHEFWFTESMCGCRGCTNYDGRRMDRRRTRHDARRSLRDVVKYSDPYADTVPYTHIRWGV